jgi:RNA polymerase sigma-70 factor (ECF subfamily)
MTECASQSGIQIADATRQRESAMIACILAGERELFHDLIRPYERMLFNACHGMLRNPEEAEDAVQDAVLKAFRGLKGFRAEAKFSTWIVTIATNEARNRLRRQKIVPMESLEGQTEPFEGDVTPAILRDWRPVPSEVLESQQIRAMIESAVGELPPIYREVFMLRDVEELNVQETAEALGIEPGAVKTRLHRARMMLQKLLAPALAASTGNNSPAEGVFRRWAWRK